MKTIFIKNKFKNIIPISVVLGVITGLCACQNEGKAIIANQGVTKSEDRLARVEQNVADLLAKMTLSEKVSLAHASGKFHVNAIERVGIPEMWLSDGPHGVRHQIERNAWASAG